jgi:hypothetical protein
MKHSHVVAMSSRHGPDAFPPGEEAGERGVELAATDCSAMITTAAWAAKQVIEPYGRS